MRLDLHIHSRYSEDSRQDVRTILRTARARGLDGVAVTDHETLAGSRQALALNEDHRFYVVPGVEYATDRGHILAYFLEHEPDLSGAPPDARGLRPWRPVVQAIHAAGGLAFLAHPFSPPKDVPPEVWESVDGVEVFNGRAGAKSPRANLEAAAAARRFGLAVSAGSDAHWPGEIGRAVWEVPGEPGRVSPAQLKELLAQGAGRGLGAAGWAVYEPLSQLVKVFRTRTYRRLPRVLAKLFLAAARDLAAPATRRARTTQPPTTADGAAAGRRESPEAADPSDPSGSTKR